MVKIHPMVSIDSCAYSSRLRLWHPGYKTLLSVAAIAVVIGSGRFDVSLLTLVFMSVLTVGAGKIRLGNYLRLLKIPAAFILMGAIALAIQVGTGNKALFEVRFFSTGLYVTGESLSLAFHTVGKAFAAVSAFYMLTLSTPMGEIISVFRRLHVPTVLLELMHLIYRYIFILSEINQRQKEAAEARLGYWGFRTSCRTFGGELANLLLLSLRRANDCYDAMEARGYDGTGRFWEENRSFTGKQALWGILYLGCLGVLFLAIWRGGAYDRRGVAGSAGALLFL